MVQSGRTTPRPPDPSSVRLEGSWRHRDVSANGIRLHVAEALPSVPHRPGVLPPLILLVHGLGGIWWTLRHQLVDLAEAGFHAVAVDLRGHGDSDKPPRGYDAWTLAGDVTNLVRALGHSSAVLVGHGEGGFVSWTAAYRRPRAVRGLVVVGSGHPLAVRRATLRDPVQRASLLPGLVANQVPRIPERRLTADGAAAVERLLHERSGPEWLGTDDFGETAAILRSAMLIPKVAHLSLESQRWMFRSQFRGDGRDFRRALDSRLSTPVLAVTGTQDRYILPATVRGSERWCAQLQTEELDGAGHYPPMERPGETSRLVATFAETDGFE